LSRNNLDASAIKSTIRTFYDRLTGVAILHANSNAARKSMTISHAFGSSGAKFETQQLQIMFLTAKRKRKLDDKIVQMGSLLKRITREEVNIGPLRFGFAQRLLISLSLKEFVNSLPADLQIDYLIMATENLRFFRDIGKQETLPKAIFQKTILQNSDLAALLPCATWDSSQWFQILHDRGLSTIEKALDLAKSGSDLQVL
jgi:hypothetical protein